MANAVFSALIRQLRQPRDAAREIQLPPERNLIFDVLAEGRRKKTIYLTGDAELGHLRNLIASHKAQEIPLSLTACLGKALACALQEQPEMQSYLRGSKKRIVFNSIDLACMIERELPDGCRQPLHYIIRDCQNKSLPIIQQELQQARIAPVGAGGPLSPLENWFLHWPGWLRWFVWLWIRRDPYTSKQLMGTVGLTSIGMFGSGAMLILPISPLTLTLSIGGVSKKLIIKDGQLDECESIQFALAADHDVIDGAPLMRFASRLKEIIAHGHPNLA
ncbi:2-oxo acid dehydrogenase subunit E2 [Chitinilyticum piscinae]|uniref:2-oxo acid dehydrogenase subunit E2 n=1 Tax=Chitinilyticum piscinae TaxID=2866724 RepID=A0A8J7FEB5_9NEIS|nr:2-oxo acid dehydrogenase subunit E2 [Chitinilyticum piscinae]MBE9607833.1 2-oxo acid dehydrogenase subunit E2 [Chitinilyticum piscinae]